MEKFGQARVNSGSNYDSLVSDCLFILCCLQSYSFSCLTEGSQMPRHLISDAHEWINEIPTVPIYALANLQQRERALHDWRGKKTLLSLTLGECLYSLNARQGGSWWQFCMRWKQRSRSMLRAGCSHATWLMFTQRELWQWWETSSYQCAGQMPAW